jgi:hypothetical protein
VEVASDERIGLGEQAVWVSEWSPGRVPAGGRSEGADGRQVGEAHVSVVRWVARTAATLLSVDLGLCWSTRA